MECSHIDFNQMIAVSNGEYSFKEVLKMFCLRYFFGQDNHGSNDKMIIYMKFLPNRHNDMKLIKFWLFKGVFFWKYVYFNKLGQKNISPNYRRNKTRVRRKYAKYL